MAEKTDGDGAAAKRTGALYLLGRLLLVPLFRLIYRPRVTGRANIPKTGPLIIASNHLSFIDSVVIPLLAPRRVRFLAKSSYFTQPGVKGRLAKAFFTAIGAVPVERGAGQAALDALDQGKRILDTGDAFALYPEGTRSLDGRLYRGRTGVAWLALHTGAPVLPVGLIGTDRLQPVGTRIPRLHRITVAFGTPIDLCRPGRTDSSRARRQGTDEVMRAIAALSGQEEAGSYNEAPAVGTVERVKRAVLRRERL